MNISKINNYMLQKKMSLVVDKRDYFQDPVNPNIVFGAIANLESWNVTISKELIEELLKVSEKDFLNKYYNPLVETFKYMKGDDVSHNNFVFQNFPESCRDISSEKLSEMRFLRYYTVIFDEVFGTDTTSQIMDGEKPEYIARPAAKAAELEVIKKAIIDDFYILNQNLIGGKLALSTLDREIVDFAINEKDINNSLIIPEEIPYKETLALMFKYDMDKQLHLDLPLNSYIDFKRTLSVLSDQDPSDKKIKLRKFTDKEKIYLLKKLERAYNNKSQLVGDQMYKDRQFIYHLGQYWKMGRYKSVCPNINSIVTKIQNNSYHVYTEARKKEEAVLSKDVIRLHDLLKNQPGEYFRRLYFMLNNAKNQEQIDIILDDAKPLASKVSNNILLSANKEIISAEHPEIVRTVFPHGNTRQAAQYESFKKPLNKKIIDRVDEICKTAMINRLSKKLDFSNEKIYISKDMKLCPVPFGVKDESGGGRTLTKGTYFDIEDQRKITLENILEDKRKDNILRLFVYKEIPEGGGFVDLSVSFLDKNCELVDQCSWTNLKTSEDGYPLAVHSGDGHDCEKGLSEFIDIDLKTLDNYAKEKNVSYIAMQIHSWNSIPFKNMKRCFAGVMRTDDMIKEKIPTQSRYKIFDPKIVKSKIDLTGSEISCIPFIYDIKKNKCIVTDIALGKSGYYSAKKNNSTEITEKLLSYAQKYDIALPAIENYPTLESCSDLVSNITRNIVNNHYPNLYELYHLAAVAGGATKEHFTINEKDATISFSWNGTITPYDRDVITKTFMTLEKDVELNSIDLDEEELKQSFNLYTDLVSDKECLLGAKIEQER